MRSLPSDPVSRDPVRFSALNFVRWAKRATPTTCSRTARMVATDVVVDFGSSIVKVACQVWAGPLAGVADTVVDLIRRSVEDRLHQRRLERLFDQCVDAVAEKLVGLLGHEARRISPNEVIAAFDA